jgi:hypothetical protein
MTEFQFGKGNRLYSKRHRPPESSTLTTDVNHYDSILSEQEQDYEVSFDEVRNNLDEETSLQPLLFNLLDEQMLPLEEKIEIEENRFTVFLSGSKMIQGTDSMVKF